MGQIIMTSTYAGKSSFVFRARVETIRGRQLSAREVRARGFMTPDLQRRHARNDYVFDWYEVEPGDVILLTVVDDESDEPQEYALGLTEKPLVDPPQNPDHEYSGINFVEWLLMNLKLA